MARLLMRAVRESVARQLARRAPIDACAAVILYAALRNACVALFTLLALLAIETFILRRRTQGAFTAARRIEARFPKRAGVITTALELEEPPRDAPTEFERATLRLANDAIKSDFYALAPIERDELLLANATTHTPTRYAILLAALGALALTPWRLDDSKNISLSPSDNENQAAQNNDAFWGDYDATLEPEASAAPLELADPFLALQTRLSELGDEARALEIEINRGAEPFDFTRAAAYLRKLKSQRSLTAALTPLLTNARDDNAPTFVAAVERIAFEQIAANVAQREELGDALEATLSAAYRAQDGEQRRDAFQNARKSAGQFRTTCENDVCALKIIAKRREIVEEDARDDARAQLYEFALDALQARVGANPGEKDEATLKIFDDRLETLKARMNQSVRATEELLTLCQNTSGRKFVAATQAQLRARATTVSPTLTPENANAELFCETLRQTARQERWGTLAYRMTNARSLPGALATVGAITQEVGDDEAANFAARLLCGEESVSNLHFVNQTVPLADARNEPKVGATLDQSNGATSEETLNAGQQAKRTTSEATENVKPTRLADASETRKSAVNDGDAHDVKTETGGGAPDDAYAGGYAADDAASTTIFDATAFRAELPPDLRARLEKSKKWRPDEKTIERARAFRRKISGAEDHVKGRNE